MERARGVEVGRVVEGLGVGVGLGMLFAPATVEQVRDTIADKAREFGGRFRSRVSGEPHAGTGTATD
jgi:hypothetical protein